MTVKKPGQPFMTTQRDGLTITWLDDGADWPGLLSDFLKRALPTKCLGRSENPARETWLAEAWGRKFIIKHVHKPPKQRRRLWDFFSGGQSSFARRMRECHKAIERGCPMVPEMYLIAVSSGGPGDFVHRYQIIEYIEGETPWQGRADPSEAAIILAEAVGRLHKWGLASGDPNPGNVVRTPGGELKVIDLSFKGPMIICQAHDILDIRRKFQARVPIESCGLKFVSWLVFLKYRWHLFRKNLKKGRK